ncbi:MAG: DUF2298 domain-containing protein [Haloarculaceae archaeon]
MGLPLADLLLPDSGDGAAGIAIPRAVIVLAVPVFWIGHLTFGVLALAIGVGVTLGLSYLAGRDGVDVSRRGVLEIVAVFTVAYLPIVLAQAASSGIDPVQSERFLDFGLFRAVLRADVLPPEDIWFAGTRVPYYYGGHFVAAVFAKFAGTPGRYAYTPALAGFFAMEVAAVSALSGAVASDLGVSPRRAALLDAEAVVYVHIGPRERNRYEVAPIGEDPGISVVFHNRAVRVFAMNRSALDE